MLDGIPGSYGLGKVSVKLHSAAQGVRLSVVLFSVFLLSCAPENPMPTAKVNSVEPQWAVDPDNPGSDLPPVGRSLFDFLVTAQAGDRKVYAVPYPFSRLTDLVQQRLRATGRSSLKRVLIPVGRSLQRCAARPDYFHYPRAVVAVDSESGSETGQAGMLLKDRLFLGYQEKADLIEVISYNEEAGRFEFQVVKNYRAGSTPQVLYPRREKCLPCHQNQAPIFSRPLWDETNANPRIASLLRAEQSSFYGIPVNRGADFPNAIDDATDRANLFSVYQLLWQQGCGLNGTSVASVNCRANAFLAVLQYRLSGYRHAGLNANGPKRTFSLAVADHWQKQWPQGLAIPNPDIPNRDPAAHIRQGSALNGLEGSRDPGGIAASELVHLASVERELEPFNKRPPVEVWYFPAMQTAVINRLISGLSEFLAVSDVRTLDRYLFEKGARGGKAIYRYGAPCTFVSKSAGSETTELRFRCHAQPAAKKPLELEGSIHLRNEKVVGGRVYHLRVAQREDLHNLKVEGGRFKLNNGHWRATFSLREQSSGLHARLTDGNAVEHVSISWSGGVRPHAGSFSGQAVATIMNDFSEVLQAVERMATQTRVGALDAFAPKPFRRVSLLGTLFTQIGIKPIPGCCMADATMPPARAE